MSLAKVIGPDIQELIRSNPKELAAAVANIHPATWRSCWTTCHARTGRALRGAAAEQGAALLSELKGETLRLVLHRTSPSKLGAELDRFPPTKSPSCSST